MDATGAFEEFHEQSTHELLSNWYVGDLFMDENEVDQFEVEVDSLKREFENEGLFKSSKLYYAFKLAFNLSICAASVVVLNYFHDSLLGVVLSV